MASAAARVEERLLLPAYASGWAPLAVAAHRACSLPLQLRGPARRRAVEHEGRSIRLLEVGRPRVTEAICRRLLGPLPEARSVGPHGLHAPGSLAGAADLVVVEVHRWLAPRLREAGWLLIPADVRWQGDLGEVPPPSPPRSLRSDLAKVRNRGFSVEHTTAPAAWTEFVRDMVRPMARARFGAEAWIPSDRLLAQFARRGVLHIVSLEGHAVAGICSISHGDEVWIPLSGIRGGDPALLQAGAGAAALSLTYGWAREQGFRRVDAGRTSPFLRDGVAHTKRKWGLHPVPDPLVPLAAVRVGSDALRAAFAREPVLVETGSGLACYGGEAR